MFCEDERGERLWTGYTVCLLCMKLGICDSPLCKDLISCFSGVANIIILWMGSGLAVCLTLICLFLVFVVALQTEN